MNIVNTILNHIIHKNSFWYIIAIIIILIVITYIVMYSRNITACLRIIFKRECKGSKKDCDFCIDILNKLSTTRIGHLFKIFLTKVLVEKGELCYQSGCDLEAEEIFSKIIEDFKESHSKWVYICLAKAYVGRGVIRQKRDNKEALEDYNRVIEKFSEENDYPDVVLAVARARLNRGTINLQNCNNSDKDKLYCLDYNELIEIERKYNKRAHHDELRKLVALQFYNKALSSYQKRKINEALTACKQALEKCKEVKKKDTENIDIDVQNVFCFHFWKGKPISRREIEVNVLMLQGPAYVQEIWNKLPDDYTDEKERGVDEYEEQVVKVIKEIGSQELVDEECKAILTEMIGFSQGNTRQLTNKRLMICESAIKIWEWLEKESLLEKETANSLKERLYPCFCGALNSVDKNYKDKNKLITICDNWVEKIPDGNIYRVGIFALSVPIHEQLGDYGEVERKCKEVVQFLESGNFCANQRFDTVYSSTQYFCAAHSAFQSWWRVCLRKAITERKGWEDVKKAFDAADKIWERTGIGNQDERTQRQVQIEKQKQKEIIEIIDNEKDDNALSRKVFNYYYKEKISFLKLNVRMLEVIRYVKKFWRDYKEIENNLYIQRKVVMLTIRLAAFITYCRMNTKYEEQLLKELEEIIKWFEAKSEQNLSSCYSRELYTVYAFYALYEYKYNSGGDYEKFLKDKIKEDPNFITRLRRRLPYITSLESDITSTTSELVDQFVQHLSNI